MKKIGKLLAITLLLSLNAKSFAQTIGIVGGVNMATMLPKDDMTNFDNKKIGFCAGIVAETGYSEVVSIQAGLIVNTKGYKVVQKADFIDTEEKLNIFYLDLPITIKGTISLGDMRVFLMSGPYAGFGLSGLHELSGTINGLEINQSNTVVWGSQNGQLNRFDYGAVVATGIQSEDVILQIQYTYGLSDVSNATPMYHRVISFSIGYMLNM